MHGGAMIMGNAWSVLPRILREGVLPLELAVILVEYRLAPQAPYPGPLEDCYAGLAWAAAHAAELDVDAWKALLGDRYGAADLPPYASPSRATDLSGLPPAFVEVGSAEIFRDEAVAYANALWQAGGQAELHVWPAPTTASTGWHRRPPSARTPATPVRAGSTASWRSPADEPV